MKKKRLMRKKGKVAIQLLKYLITIFFCSGGLSLAEDFDLPKNVLQNMLKLMEEGNLSKEEVIEHLINNGFLPVEVTELGKLPISVGKRVNFRERFKPTEHDREDGSLREVTPINSSLSRGMVASL